MPTYEYECSKCGRFEVFQRISEDPLSACPTCGGSVKRLIGGSAGIIFKGSGFHTTDYRSSEYKRKAKEESSSAEGKKTEAASVGKAS
ncbi:MAG: hypothetical protein GX493_13345 [Firmicutes bacterium]|nr:hypothetical protein [Bacillota bacterium]